MRDARLGVTADPESEERRSGMNDAAASLWQLVRDDYLARRGAWVALAVVWFSAAWAELRVLLFVPAVLAVTWVLMRRRGPLEDDSDLL
jgi:hypothetical protein